MQPIPEAMSDLTVEIYADGADVATMVELTTDPRISGFTTNPTLMRQAGVDDYAVFVKELLALVSEHPISFEVISDEFPEMERQALRLHDFADNVVVKIPITNTRGESATPLMARLAGAGVKVNATAIMTLDQVRAAADALAGGPPAIISVFAGRIADTGVEPGPVMAQAKALLRDHDNLKLLWASPREILNLVQANDAGCDIITMTPALLGKLDSLGRDHAEFSLATVKMFYDDAIAARFEF